MTPQHKDDLLELLDLMSRIEKHASEVYVRDTLGGGQVKTYILTELPVEKAFTHAFGWLRDNINRKLEEK